MRSGGIWTALSFLRTCRDSGREYRHVMSVGEDLLGS